MMMVWRNVWLLLLATTIPPEQQHTALFDRLVWIQCLHYSYLRYSYRSVCSPTQISLNTQKKAKNLHLYGQPVQPFLRFVVMAWQSY